MYRNKFSDLPVKKCSKILSSYDETPLEVLGEITVKVKYKNCLLFIAKRSWVTTLLGRDLMKTFGFYIAEVNEISQNAK